MEKGVEKYVFPSPFSLLYSPFCFFDTLKSYRNPNGPRNLCNSVEAFVLPYGYKS